jgi:hypothetical protein
MNGHLPNENSAPGTHTGLYPLEDANTVVIRPVMNNIPQPIHICFLCRIFIKEVMLHKLDTPCFQRSWVLLRPDTRLGQLEHWAAILKDEIQVGVNVR